MGCDIHATLEYDTYYDRKLKRDGTAKHSWYSFAKNIYIDRNYTLFTVFAGVRNTGVRPIISTPRGIPENASYDFVIEYNDWSPDAHSPSYVMWSELRDWTPETDSIKDYSWDIKQFKYDDWYKVMKMLADKYGDENVRLCFFFDN